MRLLGVLLLAVSVKLGAATISTNLVLGVHPSLLTNYVSNYFATGISNYNTTNATASLGTNSGGVFQKSPVAYWVVRDVKASGTVGGAGSSANWTTRVLNNLTSLSSATFSNAVTLTSSNTVLLTAGSYIVDGEFPSYGAGAHKARMMDLSASNVLFYGSSAYSAAGGSDSDSSESRLSVVLDITNSTYFRFDHYITGSTGTQDFGVPTSIGGVSEYYSTLKITKLAN